MSVPTTAEEKSLQTDLPGNYLTETLAPQGVHKLADPDSKPLVSKKEFPPGNTLGAGLWECTPGTWEITRTTTETFLVLKGKATITESDGSVRVELVPGLWHTTPSGWSGRWEVTDTVRKMFILSP
jgi:uncharacterized cupin superfamily protein